MFKKIALSSKTLGLAAALTLGGLMPADRAAAQEPTLGQVTVFAFNFCPRGWAPASGAIISINQNQALFSLLGTTFGGDGRTTFGLPDLRGRQVIGLGQGPGLSNYTWGAHGGNETLTMTINEMPNHNHSLNATNNPADQRRPNGDILAFPDVSIDGAPLDIYNNGTPESQMAPSSIGTTGGNQPMPLRDPYLAMTVCIATQGIYPSRS